MSPLDYETPPRRSSKQPPSNASNLRILVIFLGVLLLLAYLCAGIGGWMMERTGL
jgi:hypothetical protein